MVPHLRLPAESERSEEKSALMKTSLLPLLVFLFSYPVPTTLLHAQDAPLIFFGDDTVEVSISQDARFTELEETLGNEIASLKEKIDDLKAEYQRKLTLFEKRRIDILTPDPKAKFEKDRWDRIERESIRQHASDIDYLAKMLSLLRDIQTMETFEILEGPQRANDGKIPLPSDSDSVVYVDKHYFFSEPLAIDSDARVTIAAILRNYKSFAAYEGGKFCGGFHPDANIKLKTRDASISVLLCFGCAEARIIGKDIDMMVELEPDAYSALRTECYRHFRKHKAPKLPH